MADESGPSEAPPPVPRSGSARRSGRGPGRTIVGLLLLGAAVAAVLTVGRRAWHRVPAVPVVRGGSPSEGGGALASSPDVRFYAQQGGQRHDEGRVAAIAAALRVEVERSGRFVAPGFHSAIPPRRAAQLAADLRRNRAGRVRSLEAALLLVAVAREAGVPVALAEINRTEEGAVADPTGATGAFGAAVYAARVGDGPQTFFDPLGGTVGHATPLDDALADAFVLATRARGILSEDPELRTEALTALAAARKAAGPSPPATLLAIEALAFLRAGSFPEAREAADRALAARDDPARHFVRALVESGVGDEAGATRDIEAATAKASLLPALCWAGVHALATGEEAKARRFLARAEALGQVSAGLHLLRAQLAMAGGKPAQAAAELNEMVAADPDDLPARVSAVAALLKLHSVDLALRLRAEAEQHARNPDAARRLMARFLDDPTGPVAAAPPPPARPAPAAPAR